MGVLLALVQSLGSAGSVAECWAEPLLDVVCNAHLPRRAEAWRVHSPADPLAIDGADTADQQMVTALIAAVISHMDHQRCLPPQRSPKALHPIIISQFIDIINKSGFFFPTLAMCAGARAETGRVSGCWVCEKEEGAWGS